jgi:hypothetical protein
MWLKCQAVTDMPPAHKQRKNITPWRGLFESSLALYNFSDVQSVALGKIKDAFVANLSSHGRVDIDAIFANPIYARLIGNFEDINRKFDGHLREIVEGMQGSF